MKKNRHLKTPYSIVSGFIFLTEKHFHNTKNCFFYLLYKTTQNKSLLNSKLSYGKKVVKDASHLKLKKKKKKNPKGLFVRIKNAYEINA